MDLNSLVDEIEDISDPASMDKVLMYLREIEDEDEHFMQLLLDRLDGESVYWPQPWYQSMGGLSRRLDATNEKSDDQYRTDPICEEEIQRIKKNWKKFIKKYDLPDKLLSFSRWRNKKESRSPHSKTEKVRRYVVSYLARGLDRTLYQVFKYVMSHLLDPPARRYTKEEEKIMEICFIHKPNTAVIYLTALLCREPRGIYKRLRQLFAGYRETKRMKWTIPLATKLVNSIMHHTGLPLEELKCKVFDKSVWLKVQEDMEQNYAALSKFWYTYLHVQIFVGEDVKLNKLRKKIFKILRESPYKVWTDIRWKDVLKHFPDGYTHYFLYHVCSTILRKQPKYTKLPIETLIGVGLKKAKSIRFQHRRLRRMKLNDEGTLERAHYNFVKEDNSE